MDDKKFAIDYLSKLQSYHLIYNEQVEVKRKGILRNRTRGKNLNEALRLTVQDPLWMLARQWQMGEFKGNDTAAAISMKCVISQKNMDSASEYDIERDYQEVTPYVRLESAMHYIKLCSQACSDMKTKLAELRKKYPLEDDYVKCGIDNEMVKEIAKQQNTKLVLMMKAFGNKAFDGYKLYLAAKSSGRDIIKAREYVEWFERRYFVKNGNNPKKSKWDNQQMRYVVDANTHSIHDYSGGRLTWYSYNEKDNNNKAKTETLFVIPTIATYANAPAKRLWEFEDEGVYMGNSLDGDQSQANVVMMQYAAMYSNDMLMVPISTTLGKYIEVDEIQVWDTFGDSYSSKNAKPKKSVKASQEWGMFDLSRDDGKPINEKQHIFIPECFPYTVESKPMEEVQFLRDEMANMVWGVETIIPDGAGSTLDGKAYSTAINDCIIDHNVEEFKKIYGDKEVEQLRVRDQAGVQEASTTKNSDFRYTIQTQVPLNWIPFLPQQMLDSKGKVTRENVLRRGKMPCFIYDKNGDHKDFLYPVRPVTSLIETEMETKRSGKIGEKPYYVNEEEVLQTGIKIVKNYQRARGLDGKVYFWYGTRKELSGMDANSGLTFDKLKEK